MRTTCCPGRPTLRKAWTRNGSKSILSNRYVSHAAGPSPAPLPPHAPTIPLCRRREHNISPSKTTKYKPTAYQFHQQYHPQHHPRQIQLIAKLFKIFRWPPSCFYFAGAGLVLLLCLIIMYTLYSSFRKHHSTAIAIASKRIYWYDKFGDMFWNTHPIFLSSKPAQTMVSLAQRPQLSPQEGESTALAAGRL